MTGRWGRRKTSGANDLLRYKLADYLNTLEHSPADTSHIEHSKDKEIGYFREFLYRFQSIIESFPRSNNNLAVLDIGTTPFTFFLKESFPSYAIATLDKTDHMKNRCDLARIRHRSCDLDDGIIPFKNESFDVVIFTEVLEHVFCPPSKIMWEVRRVLRPSGLLILSVPNIAKLTNRLKLLLGRQILQGPELQMKKEGIHGHGHIHEYTKEEIVSICKYSGLEVIKSKIIGEPPITVIHKLGLKHPLRCSYHCLKYIFPSFRNTIQVDCRKRDI